jgi:hypothetical protein
MPAERAEQVIALQVRLSLLSVDETAGKTGGNSMEKAIDHGLKLTPVATLCN